MLNSEPLSISSRVLEVGPGDSELINALATRFEHITAIDNSEAMLDRAQTVLDPELHHKVEFIHADIDQVAQLQHRCYELVVLNMVLHNMASPAALFTSAGKLLTPGGFLLIVDLCPHDQDWARDTCGDLWLGFEPSDLDSWAQDARLVRGQGIYLGLKNGFQIQARLFYQPQPITSIDSEAI